MDSGKRASMREGPLAALFRRTDEEGLEGERRPPERRQRPKEEPPAERKPATGRPFPASESGDVAEHAEELRPAPPSARVEHAPETPAGRPARSPEQRLRDVFSADIPENIMERSAAPAPPRDEYRGRYGREEPQVSGM